MKKQICSVMAVAAAFITAAFVMTGCGTMKRSSRVDSSAMVSEQTTLDRATAVQQVTTEHVAETEVAVSGSEHETTTTETTTTTEYSPPDSLGRQHRVRETVSVKRVEESERKGSVGRRDVGTEREAVSVIADTLHVASNVTAVETASVASEKERKSGLGGYLWAFGGGAVLVAVAGVGIWIWRKKKILPL
jgi:hypothetical protein